MDRRIKYRNLRTMMGAVALVFSVAFVFAPPSTALAQGTEDGMRALEALERTDEVIARAKQIVDETRSEKGRVALRFAMELQTRAWTNYRGNGYRLALRLTLEARDEAWHAMSLARADIRSEESHARVAEEARERLQNVRDMMIDGGLRDDHAMKLIDEARGLLDKSRTNAQQNRYQLALRLAANARQLAVKAEERVRSTRMLKESLERRIALLERLMERSRDRVGEKGDDKTRAEIRAAERKLEQAREQLAAGRYREARQSCDACERMLRAAVRLVPPAAGEAGVHLEQAYRLLERAREMREDGGDLDPRTTQTMARAREMLDRAGEEIAAGRENEGLALVERAREMLRNTVREEGGALSGERVMERIAHVERIREEARNLAGPCSAPGVKELVERADAHLARAREHAGASRFEQAAAETAIARNMYQRISDLCAR